MYPLFPIMFLFWLPMWTLEAMANPPYGTGPKVPQDT
jgi:hypothetical protein